MKKIFFTAAIAILGLVSCNERTKTKEPMKASEIEANEVQAKGSYIGEQFDSEEMITLTSLMEEMDKSDSLNASVEVKVTEVCQSKGCWMTTELPNGETMRITF